MERSFDSDRRPRGRDDEGGDDEGEDRGRGGPRRIRVCQFCAEKNKTIDYKNVDVLRGLISDRGKIRPRPVRRTSRREEHFNLRILFRAIPNPQNLN